jgi:hypothetical protein
MVTCSIYSRYPERREFMILDYICVDDCYIGRGSIYTLDSIMRENSFSIF